ncbi:hypothetical protein WJX73_000795 [Symbiochloris irregularis]|uniref:Uncharacterized protein n=1 Tax=Symbiochloris irregularis TaxID=706552 RepID=A0AAW1NSI9_9CHLO
MWQIQHELNYSRHEGIKLRGHLCESTCCLLSIMMANRRVLSMFASLLAVRAWAVVADQMRMDIGFNIQICDALSWLVVLVAWVRKTPDGRPYGILMDLAVYWGLAVAPAAFAGWLLEVQARNSFLARHRNTRPVARDE